MNQRAPQHFAFHFIMTYMRYLSVLLVALGLQSCVTHEELVNFTEAAFPLDSAVLVGNATELRVQPLDLLHITVNSFDPEAAAPFNPQQGQGMMQMQMGGGGGGGGGSNGMELFHGYFVDGQGAIDFPVLGQIPVAGKTIDQVRDDMYSRIQPYLNDASINVRYLNLKISVLGEVRSPGLLRLSNPRTTLLEAISMAGDLTPYANRRNILLIREIDGQRTFTRIDLQRRDFIDSPYYYLRQNDVVYVEPIQAKVATVADPVQRFIAYSSGVLSLITFILALTR